MPDTQATCEKQNDQTVSDKRNLRVNFKIAEAPTGRLGLWWGQPTPPSVISESLVVSARFQRREVLASGGRQSPDDATLDPIRGLTSPARLLVAAKGGSTE